jgi:hypothetical protein
MQPNFGKNNSVHTTTQVDPELGIADKAELSLGLKVGQSGVLWQNFQNRPKHQNIHHFVSISRVLFSISKLKCSQNPG